ncbi:MAG TPA: TolC family protein [Bryobacteraceae bacterium]|nr:TolC family protein [Bryobacteraceae bacterium]
MSLRARLLALAAAAPCLVFGQSAQTPPPQPAPSLTITLADAISRAHQYGTQVQSAALNTALAAEDTRQARANRLPTLNALNQYIYTQGDRTPSGVFVANDGVHVYNEQAVVHQELLNAIRKGEVNRALAAEAVAKARADLAARSLDFTVIQDYYAIVSAQRKAVNVQTALDEARHFLDITEKQESGGEVARADVVKARISLQQSERALQDAQLAIEKARIALGVLIFPDFRSDYAVEDDIAKPLVLQPYPEAEAKAKATSPDLHAAQAVVQQAGYETNIARYAWVPSLGLDFFYGLDSNRIAIDTTLADGFVRRNLGYSGQITLNIPVWNWGATRSKIKQAEIHEQQAKLDLSLTQRELAGNLASFYKEAQTAQAQLDSLRATTDLAIESLRLTLLRYEAGEATALEVVDAQTTEIQARNAQEDGLVRYRVALANLQTLTGNQ